MDFKRIRHALAVAEEKSFARAADKVNLSQPALSRSIQTLEEELGVLLFDRDNRNVAVTSVGAVFLARARKLAYEMRGLERDMALLRSGDGGTVAFGAGPLLMAGVIPPLTDLLRERHPGLRISIATNNWRQLQAQLRGEQLEFFISDTHDIEPAPDLTITPLFRQYGCLLVRAGHPLLNRPLRIEDLLDYGLASVTLPDRVKPLVHKICGIAQDAALPISLQCDQVPLLIHATINSDLVLLSTEAACQEALAAGQLVLLDVPGLAGVATEVGVVQLYGRTMSPGAAITIETLREVAANTVATIAASH
ncbi:LysR family transcriptional regulator [Pseudoduganella ginsengisoli]|uniref:LysR family transcriptional regulator n=1 Tax=Pseudoduganella ginsengisoli TaxID=1462440 RepID=A0A6L6Q6E5_9BURK|nr:LysR family transcriptional regulator [Pseudoduganella ginsengisoli]MTW05004.1 LysR family transcriptional regulator [Pseudoduganella ginsengisoli]